jgi:predicted  nucleic acid-binding Zn-ribbon protein
MDGQEYRSAFVNMLTQNEHTFPTMSSELELVRTEIAATKAELVEFAAEVKKAKDDGRREAYLVLQNTVAYLQSSLAELRRKENRLEETQPGNVILREINR